MKLLKNLQNTFVLTKIIQYTLFCFFIASCTKENDLGPVTSEPPPTPVISNEPPIANAGRDTTITLPANAILTGQGSYDPEGKTITFKWNKIKGPNSIIESPNMMQTTVSGLQQGIYQFELIVTDTLNLIGRDTVEVKVSDRKDSVSGSNPIIFHNLTWIFPWDNSLEVKDINSYVLPNRPLKIFIQRDFDSTWREVNPLSLNWVNDPYEYFIETRPFGAGMYNYGSLYIIYYGSNTSDTPNVKVQF